MACDVVWRQLRKRKAAGLRRWPSLLSLCLIGGGQAISELSFVLTTCLSSEQRKPVRAHFAVRRSFLAWCFVVRKYMRASLCDSAFCGPWKGRAFQRGPCFPTKNRQGGETDTKTRRKALVDGGRRDSRFEWSSVARRTLGSNRACP